MMVERNHDEDEHSFRQRLDGMTEKFREKRRAWSDSTSQAGSATKQKGQQALAADLEALIARFNRSGDASMVVPSEYLEVLVTRR